LKIVLTVVGLFWFCLPARAWAASKPDYTFEIGGAIFVIAVCVGLFLLVRWAKRKDKAVVDDFKARDSGFDEQVFLSQAADVFFRIKQAWIERDLEPVRALMTPELFRGLEGKLHKYVTNGTFNRLDELQLNPPAVRVIKKAEENDLIGVWMRFKARDYTVNRAGTKVSGSNKVSQRDEQWTFLRPMNTVTKPKGVCPACGSMGQGDECGACHAKIQEFNWLLYSINNIEVGDSSSIFDIIPDN
jgi:hypothetical protein